MTIFYRCDKVFWAEILIAAIKFTKESFRTRNEKSRGKKKSFGGRIERVDLRKDYCASKIGQEGETPRRKEWKEQQQSRHRRAKVASRCGMLQDRPRKNFAPVVSTLSPSPSLWMCGSFYGVGGHHYHHRRRRHRCRRHHLLLFFVFFLLSSSPPFSVSPSVPRRRNMAPRQEIRPSTPSLSQQPRTAPSFLFLLLASFLPPPVPVPPPPDAF